ncbi:MAG: hypothetical protein GVY36_13285 [Verrucomicrobia bacterium]|nr:hypothetical protein [Verrucomicrobiota bacterium]
MSKQLLARYRIEGAVEIETTPDAIVLRPLPSKKLNWEETYCDMAAGDAEDWSEWEAVAEDGIDYEN